MELLQRIALPSTFALVSASLAAAQTITVTIPTDVVDVNWQTATVADLPGPDGEVSLSEAFIAANHTPGHQTIAFAIPQNLWTLQFLHPGCAVLTAGTGFFLGATDQITLDATTQTAFTGDTNPDGGEVVIYQHSLGIGAPGSVARGFHHTNLSVGGTGCLVEGNTGQGNIDIFGGGGSTVRGNEASTLSIDRSNGNVVVGNTLSRVRINGFGSAQLATGNRIGGPAAADRNHIIGFGTWNSEGLPNGTLVELQDTADTVIENNTIGTTPDGMAQGHLASTIGIGFRGRNDGTLVRDNLIAGILGRGQGPHHGGQLFGWAVLFWGAGTGSGVSITGNTIGLDASGAPTLGSVWGIDVGSTQTTFSSDLRIGGAGPGEGNVIAGHRFNGITIGRNADRVRISGNRIHSNGWLGIDLVPPGFGYGVTANDPLDADVGVNGLQNFPELTLAALGPAGIEVLGALDATPSSLHTIEFFAAAACDPDGHGEAETFLGSTQVTTDALGRAWFSATLPPLAAAGASVSATATLEATGATSEFSACEPLVAATDLGVAHCGPAAPNSTGASGSIRARGSARVADGAFHLVADHLPPHQFVLFVASDARGSIPNPGGSQGDLCLGGTLGRFVGQLTSSGALGATAIQVDLGALPPPLSVPVQPGSTWNFQAWYRDVNPSVTSNLTDAVEVQFQ